jgi:hypothetical protein
LPSTTLVCRCRLGWAWRYCLEVLLSGWVASVVFQGVNSLSCWYRWMCQNVGPWLQTRSILLVHPSCDNLESHFYFFAVPLNSGLSQKYLTLKICILQENGLKELTLVLFESLF